MSKTDWFGGVVACKQRLQRLRGGITKKNGLQIGIRDKGKGINYMGEGILDTRVRHLPIFQYRSKNHKKIVRANVPRNHKKKQHAWPDPRKNSGIELFLTSISTFE